MDVADSFFSLIIQKPRIFIAIKPCQWHAPQLRFILLFHFNLVYLWQCPGLRSMLTMSPSHSFKIRDMNFAGISTDCTISPVDSKVFPTLMFSLTHACILITLLFGSPDRRLMVIAGTPACNGSQQTASLHYPGNSGTGIYHTGSRIDHRGFPGRIAGKDRCHACSNSCSLSFPPNPPQRLPDHATPMPLPVDAGSQVRGDHVTAANSLI